MNTIDRILGEGKVRPPTEEELTNPYRAFDYAKDVIGGRFPEGEAVIATDPKMAPLYLNAFPKTQGDPCSTRLLWAMNGWIDWLDL